jgi:hypothetical protein
VKYFGANGGRIYPTPAELAARNIVFNN